MKVRINYTHKKYTMLAPKYGMWALYLIFYNIRRFGISTAMSMLENHHGVATGGPELRLH